MALPDASTKLRMVLDYVPCEACLAHPVADQDLLCGICARLDRQIAVRVATRTTYLVERPSPPPEPVVILPALAPAPEVAPPALPEVVVRFASDPPSERVGVVEVVVEPLAPPPPPEPEPAPVPAPLAAAAPAEAPAEEEGPLFEDLFVYTKARDEFFDYRKEPTAPPPVEPRAEPEPRRAPPPPPSEPIPEDDFVFRPPAVEETPAPEPTPVARDDIIPEEEVPVEAPREDHDRWAPPPDLLPDEAAPVAEPAEEPAVQPEPEPEPEVLELEPVEEEILETTVEEEPLTMEVLPDEEPPAPSGTGELYRLRGFDAEAERALAQARITEISHLSGHDAGELAGRTGLPQTRLAPWIQVADLVHEVGVPVDSAVALVAAGVAGPKGLRDADADEVADRASAFGGHQVNARDVKRWKRRA